MCSSSAVWTQRKNRDGPFWAIEIDRRTTELNFNRETRWLLFCTPVTTRKRVRVSMSTE